MYNNVLPGTAAGVLPATAAAGLAFTGANSLWYALAAFALVATGTALLRIVPKRAM